VWERKGKKRRKKKHMNTKQVKISRLEGTENTPKEEKEGG